MTFKCPKCQSKLKIDSCLDIPYDSRSDEISLQILRCEKCPFSCIAIYEESRRGAIDSECVDYNAYKLEASEVERLAQLISKCPNPRNPDCPCPIHMELGKQDKDGRWIGIKEVNYKNRL